MTRQVAFGRSRPAAAGGGGKIEHLGAQTAMEPVVGTVEAPVLGVNIKSGAAYLALVRSADDFALGSSTKVAPSTGLTDATRLKDFADRFLQEVRRLEVRTVVVAHTRKYRGWTYASAFERISLEAAIMLAVENAGVRYVSVKQDKVAARLVGISKPEEVEEELAGALAIDAETVKHWDARSVALMVAIAAVKGVGG